MAAWWTCRRLPKFRGTCLNILRPSQRDYLRHGSSVTLYEKNKKGTDEDLPKESLAQKLHYYMHNLVPETKKLIQEQKQGLTSNVMLEAEHGNYEVVFRFNDKATVDKWIVTADRDNAGGKSTADFVLTQNRTGLFRGQLCMEVPKDGKTKYAGYANISSPAVIKSFRRETHWDWSLYNCLLMKVRGDGRTYSIVIGCDFYYDINWLKRWTFPLYTRGGPYWQVAKIPFSKFFLSHKGRIQDRQDFIPLSIVNSFGITAAGGAEGSYSLEIDNIAVMYDANLSEKLIYEQYHDRNFLSQN